MRLDKKTKPNDRVAVALVLCFCVVAIASIFSMRSNLEQLGLGDDDKINISQENETNKAEQNVVKPVPTVDSTAPKQENNQGSEKSTIDGNYDFTIPVIGKITKEFSSDVPIYSKTLDQFTIHNGIDIEAPADTQVFAIADGTVTKVFKDDKLGLTIEITHTGGLVTKYSNLSTTKMVGEGDVVKKGAVISGVGNTALFESLESPHLHFEVIKDGVQIDPIKYVKK